MTLAINTNLASLTAQESQRRTLADVSHAIARLSSGLRINGAQDDAAGLSIAARFSTQIRGTTQAARNANDAISLTQTADGALGSVSDNLQRIRELAVQSSNASNSSIDRASLQSEVSQLQAEIDRVATQTSFNGINLLDGSFTSEAFQVGANAGETITVGSLPNARVQSLGSYTGFAALNQTVLNNGYDSNPTYSFAVKIGSGPMIDLGTIGVDLHELAAAINAAHIPGMNATSGPALFVGNTSAAAATGAGTAVLTINGQAINLAGLTGAASLSANRSAAVSAINALSANTGVVASDTGHSVDLGAADGRNINVAYSAGTFAGSSEADFGLPSAGVAGGTLNDYYQQPPGFSGNAAFYTNGVNAFTYGVGTTGPAVGALDISTPAGATDAITCIDRALATVSSARASLGAIQNRVASTIANLQSKGENLAASRSRIQDADFAAETASLARAQVLQHASNAMIAQANQLPDQVLVLLKA